MSNSSSNHVVSWRRPASSDSPSAVSADRLTAFYVVVVAFALENTVASVFDTVEKELERPQLVTVGLLSVATIVTLVPFAHGALRHLDVQYIHGDEDKTIPTVRRWALLADFCVFLIQGVLLLAMARLGKFPEWFLLSYSALLVVDVAWALFTKTALEIGGLTARDLLNEAKAYLGRWVGKAPGRKAQLSWAFNNAMFLLPVLALLSAAKGTGTQGAIGFAAAILAVAVARTVADYWVSWTFYFPGEPAAAQVQAPECGGDTVLEVGPDRRVAIPQTDHKTVREPADADHDAAAPATTRIGEGLVS